MIERFTNGENGEGRDRSTGRFVKGWKGGPGNPLAARVHEYRVAIFNAVTTEDVADVMRTMLKSAKDGDVAAAKVILERTAGKPLEETVEPSDNDARRLLEDVDRMRKIERAIENGTA